MHHRRYDYYCVIFGWDPTCSASEEWMLQMGIHTLSRARTQPFYNVLVNDGSSRYAAEGKKTYVFKIIFIFCMLYTFVNSAMQKEVNTIIILEYIFQMTVYTQL